VRREFLIEPERIGELFSGFQRFLYEPRAA
jgi:hypothetical protein